MISITHIVAAMVKYGQCRLVQFIYIVLFVDLCNLCDFSVCAICRFVQFVASCHLLICSICRFVQFVALCNLMICVICQCRYVDMSTCGIRVCGFVIMCHSLICQYVSLPICVVNLPKCVNSVVC